MNTTPTTTSEVSIGAVRKKGADAGNVISSRMVPIPSNDFSQTLFAGLNKAGSAPIIKDVLQNRASSGQDVVEASERLARHLLSLGCVKGDVVAIFSPNSIEWLVVLAAAFRIGVVPAGINHLFLSGELRHHLRICNAKIVYTVHALAPMVLKVVKDFMLETVVIVDDEHPGCTSLQSILKNRNNYHRLPRLDELGLKPLDPGLILFSSGTTGISKAVVLTHRNLQSCNTLQEQPEVNSVFNNQLLVSPFSHAASCCWLLNATARGYTTNFFSRFHFIKYLEFVDVTKLEILYLVTPVVVMLAKSPEVDRFRLNHVKSILSTGVILSKGICERLCERFPGVKVRQGYGMTELTGFALVVPNNEEVTGANSSQSIPMWRLKSGSVGKPICNTEMKVIDVENGRSLGPGELGELCIRSPLVTLGYLCNPEVTKQTIEKDGWMHTGDIFYYDQDGYFFIVDRIKELIKYNASQVSPTELETVLLSHPEVVEAGVVGLPNEVSGELPAACVVLRPGSTTKEKELERFVADQVAPQKRLRGGVRFFSSLPKTPTGKLLRRELKAVMINGKL